MINRPLANGPASPAAVLSPATVGGRRNLPVAIGGALALSLLAVPALASPVFLSGGWSSLTQTEAPTIPTPSGTVVTTFDAYSSSFLWNYVLLPFTVSTSGLYTAAITTSPVTNTTWFLTGLFDPGPSPSTPIENFFAGELSPSSSSPFATNFESLSLSAGTQYSVLIAFNTGGDSDTDAYTLSMDGPGCVSIGDNACAVPEPASLGIFLLGLAGLGSVAMHRPRWLNSLPLPMAGTRPAIT